MSDHQRYDKEEQWDDLPLPDQEASWQKMKQLLDEDDNDCIIPPVSLRSCAGWGLMILLIMGGVWLVIHNRSGHEENKLQYSVNQNTSTDTRNKIQKQQKTNTPHDTNTIQINSTATDFSHAEKEDHTITTNVTIHSIEKRYSSAEKVTSNNKTDQSLTYLNRKGQTSSIKNFGIIKKHKKVIAAVPEPFIEPASDDTTLLSHQRSLTDSSITKHTDSSRKADSVKHTKPEVKPQPKQIDKKQYYLSVGIGEQQQIPLKGQKAVPYNYYGRKGSLSDYIPSVYVRLERNKKWFVQSEFRYGAPQSVKQLSYSEVSKSDSFNRITTSTSLSVKKTYYHQIPLSFNYYILPNWSVGTGALFSKFHGAITEQTTKVKNNLTQTESVSSKLVKIPASTDSFFTKSQWYILFQTQYQWKRFSFGLRFTQGLQPYIRYKDANSQAKEEKNKTLEFTIRTRIWGD